MVEITPFTIIDFFLRTAIFLGFFILFLIMQYKTRKVSRHSVALQLAILLGVIATAIYVIDFITYTSWQDDQLRIHLHLMMFTTITLMYYSWYRHYESFISLTPPLSRHLPIFYLVALESGIATLEFVDLVRETYIMAIISHFTYIVGILSFSLAWRVLKSVHGMMQERTTAMEFLAINAILLGNVIFFVEDILVTTDIFPEFPSYYLFLLGNFLILLNLLLLISNYALHPNYIFRIPISIHTILVYNKDGILAYHRDVKSPGAPPLRLRAELLSSILSSIKNVFDHMMGERMEVTNITARNHHIYLHELPQKVGNIVLIASGESLLLIRSMKRFVQMIDESIIKMIEKHYIKSKEMAEKLDPLVLKAFPYLTFIE